MDASTASHLMQIFIQLAQAQQTTILMVNHQLELSQIFCTRLLHLHQGQLLADKLASEVDFATLQASLVQVETQAAQEWI